MSTLFRCLRDPRLDRRNKDFLFGERLVETFWESSRAAHGKEEAWKLHDDGYISFSRLKDTILRAV